MVKFQYRFKIHNTQLNRRLFTQNYFGQQKFISKSLKNCDCDFQRQNWLIT